MKPWGAAWTKQRSKMLLCEAWETRSALKGSDQWSGEFEELQTGIYVGGDKECIGDDITHLRADDKMLELVSSCKSYLKNMKLFFAVKSTFKKLF